MIKIVRIIARLNIGGPARNVVLLTEGFSIRSSTSLEQYSSSEVEKIKYKTVLVCGEVEAGEGDMMYLAREKGIEPVIIKELSRELSWKDDWVSFWKIYKIIKQEKPDIIHTHTAKAGALGRFAGMFYNLVHLSGEPDGSPDRWTRLKLVHTFHGHVFSGYFGKIKTIFFICVEKFLALFTDTIITVSEALKKELVEKYRIAPEKKFSVVELGFELEELFKLPERNNTEIINIGIVGRLVPVKNHKMLFKATKRVKGEGLRVKIVVIGDGEMKNELGRYAQELGIKSVIEFRGWIKDLKAIYEELDIVALTSLNEGTPVSLIEAMAAERPVITTNVGGIKDIVKDGVSGYLVESGDEEEFTKKLLELIKDPGKRRKFGENGRDIVKNRFSKERLIKDTKKLYNNILQKDKNN